MGIDRRTFNIPFPKEFKIKLLKSYGYTIKKEEITLYHNVYHNDVEEEKKMVEMIYYNKESIYSSNDYKYSSSDELLDIVFERVLGEELMRIINLNL